MSKPDRYEIKAVVDAVVAKLRTMGVDSAVVICTYDTPGDSESTSHFKGGFGNYYAQRGSVIEWIDQTRCVVIDNPAPPDRDDGEWWKG